MAAVSIDDGCGPYAYSRPRMVEMSTAAGMACCFGLSLIYVGSLYVWKDAMKRRRDDPDTIRQRTISVSVVTLLAPFTLLFFFTSKEGDADADMSSRLSLVFQTIGLFPPEQGISWKPFWLVIILFLGPVALWIADIVETQGRFLKFEIRDLRTLPKIRNIVVAPIAEEVVFRACMLPLLLSTPLSPCTAVFLAPLAFGTAHLHHALELRRQGHAWKNIVISVMFQCTYTSLFGSFVSYVFLRTGHLLPIILIHAWCNLVGFPAVDRIVSHPYKIVLVPCLFAGLFLFIYLFKDWTQ